jgi:spermidine synthase
MQLSPRAWLVSALTGFASLGTETLWIRLAGFANGNTPQTFGLVLGVFLLGIALGALAGKQLCERNDEIHLRAVGAMILSGSALIDVCAPWLLLLIGNDIFILPAMVALILATAASKAALFPIVHHLGGRLAEDTGRSIARVYFANIAGATLAPLLIGFWLLDLASSEALLRLLGAVSLAAAAIIAPAASLRWASVGVVASLLAATALWPQQLTLLRHLAQGGEAIAFLQENRHGIIHTTVHPGEDEAVFGGNIYDGKINLDPIRNSNHIDRVWLLQALHPAPRRVLVIGLSAGAWTRVLTAFLTVEQIDVVEINPGYLALIAARPSVAPILADPRVHIHIDDGRRWLRRHPQARYDLIVMNTTFHWRAYITNLLSREFLTLAREHLEPGGILAFNATGSPDALYTAAQVFQYAFRWKESNFVYAGNHDFRKPGVAVATGLEQVVQGLDMAERQPRSAWQHFFGALGAPAWINASKEAQLVGRPLEMITDANMVTEFRYGRVAW